MLWTVPDRQVAAVLGEVTVTAGLAIVNVTSLTSVASVSSDATRTSAVDVGGPVTAHVHEPPAAAVFSTDAASVSQVAPASRDSSIRTKLSSPRLCDHLITVLV